MEWLVWSLNQNRNVIEEYNIFYHGRFLEDVKRNLKRYESKAKFAEILEKDLLYYFRAKFEHEVVITSFPPYIEKDELIRLNDNLKMFTKQHGYEPYRMWILPDVFKKIDIYNQVRLNWNVFVDYVWKHKEGKNESN